MSIYRRFPAENLPSFVTTNTSERRRIFTSAAACEMLVRTIYDVRTETGLQLLAFTIMPDHVHLVLVSPTAGLSQVIQLIKGRFSRAYNQHVGRRGPLWQSRYHERTLRNERALVKAVEYVQQNPIAAGLAMNAADYRWSSASGRYQTDFAKYLGQAEA